MKKFFLIPQTLVLMLLLGACSKDDDSVTKEDFVVAFENPSVSFDPADTSKTIKLVFSRTASENGTITIAYTANEAVYGEDFTLEPAGESGVFEVAVASGTSESGFIFNKLQNPLEGEEKSVSFEIIAVSNPNGFTQGNTTTIVSLTESAALGGGIAPSVGGPNQPNQVYVDLSAQRETPRNRESWDLGFYSGNEFRVGINGSVYMAAAQLDFTNINEVTEADVINLQPQVAIGTFDPANMAYVDNPNGDINGTAIAAISENDADNKVYLVNLGYEVGTETPNPGSAAIAGEHRGWKKIRILRSGGNYILQYADLNATTHQTATIAKDGNFNFTFFSFNTNNTVSVEPEKTKWDLNFTVFTNEIVGYGSYGYADFVAANRKGGVKGYKVEGSAADYAGFTASDVNPGNFTNDQRFIGSDWRIGGGPDTLPTLAEDVFFIIQDPDGNIYKLRFTALLNDNGVRGYPAFEYSLLD